MQGFDFIKKELTHQDIKTTKTFMQKQPKYSTVRQIQEMVTDEEVKQNKKDPQTYTKKCLYVSTWNVTTLVTNNCKLQQLVRALDCYRLDNLDITKTHMLHSGKYILPVIFPCILDEMMESVVWVLG